MKANKLLLVSLALAGVFTTAKAETILLDGGDTVEVPKCADYYSSNWYDNWFIQVGAGANWAFFENADEQGNSYKTHRPALSLSLNAGHWFTPYLAIRFGGYGGGYKWKNDFQGWDYSEFTPEQQKEIKGYDKVYSQAKFAVINADIMWDLFNTCKGVNPKRVFSILPFAGISGQYTWDIKSRGTNVSSRYGKGAKTSTFALPVYAGIQLRFRVSKIVDIYAEYRAQFLADGANACVVGSPIDVSMAAMAGLSFNIGERKFDTINPCTYTNYIKQLNNQVNKLRGDLADLNAKVADCEAQLPCVVTEIKCPETDPAVCAAVRFAPNSSTLSEYELANVYSVAQYIKNHPNIKINVTGYANTAVGTTAKNTATAKKRATAVYNKLLEYGVSADQIEVASQEGKTQPYAGKGAWNNVVIFEAKSK